MNNFCKLLLPALLFIACSHQALAQQEEPAAWLTRNLTRYFRDSITMQEIVTKRYAAFKSDAMQADMNGGMGRKAFRKKWKHQYNTSQSGIHDGFLIPLQDWQEITVQCGLISHTRQGYWIAATITETAHQLAFSRELLLVIVGDQLRIDDVRCRP